MVNELATLRFVEEKANLLLIGPPGVGKTMIAIALGLKAVQAGYRVHYTTAADLVARTSRAADQGRWENTMRFWAGPQVLIVDELGYLPMVGEAGSHLFQVISRRYLHGTVILTTNRGIAEWGHDLRGHHRRRRDPRPAPSPRHRAADRRRELPHARAPRTTRAAAGRPQSPGLGPRLPVELQPTSVELFQRHLRAERVLPRRAAVLVQTLEHLPSGLRLPQQHLARCHQADARIGIFHQRLDPCPPRLLDTQAQEIPALLVKEPVRALSTLDVLRRRTAPRTKRLLIPARDTAQLAVIHAPRLRAAADRAQPTHDQRVSD